MKSAISKDEWNQLCDLVLNNVQVIKSLTNKINHRMQETEKTLKLLRKNGNPQSKAK